MIVKDFYDKIGGSYEEIKARLQNDDIIERFVLKFANEKSYDELLVAVADNNVEQSIVSAHKMKGVVANLSFAKLFVTVNDLLTDLRKEGQNTVNTELVQKVTEQYNIVMNAINEG